MTFKKVLSLATLVLMAVIVFASRHEFVAVWHKLQDMNLWILALLLPIQILMYFAAGQVYFSYLKEKKQLKKISTPRLMRISLEMNFVNHVIPSGGVSGLSYLAWRLRDYGITAGQAAMMQVIRYGLVSIATTLVVIISSVVLGFSGIPMKVVIFSALMATSLTLFVLVVMFILGHKKRVATFGKWFRIIINKVVKTVTFNKIPRLLKQKSVDKFLLDLHRDYTQIIKDKKILIKPFLWSVFYSLLDSSTFLVSFYALGAHVSFAPVIIAQGLASIAGTLAVTPGGTGFFEATMAAYFIATGIDPDIALGATLVTRVIVLLGTILSGWGFYQMALLKSKDKRLDVGAEVNGSSR